MEQAGEQDGAGHSNDPRRRAALPAPEERNERKERGQYGRREHRVRVRAMPSQKTGRARVVADPVEIRCSARDDRSEEHTSELQSPVHLVCRLLLEKKKKTAQAS